MTKKFDDMPDDEVVDKDKLEIIVKFSMSMSKIGPPMLILVDDDWCWAQFYMLKFLNKLCYVFPKKGLKIPGKIPKKMEVHYWDNQKELNKKSVECADKFAAAWESMHGNQH